MLNSEYLPSTAGRQAFERLAMDVRSLVTGQIEIPDVNEPYAYRRLHQLRERVLKGSAGNSGRLVESDEYKEAVSLQERNKVHNQICNELVPKLRDLRLDDISAEALGLEKGDFVAPTTGPTGTLAEFQQRAARMAAAIADWPTMPPSRKVVLCMNVHLAHFDKRLSQLETAMTMLLNERRKELAPTPDAETATQETIQ